MWTVIVLIGLLIVGYYAGRSMSKEYVRCVEAGPMEGVTAETLSMKSYYAPRTNLKVNGVSQSKDKLIRVVVNGDCMKPRNIIDGTQLYVKRISKKADVKNIIHKGDILMLYLSDSKKYKIREFKEFVDNGAFKTFYYNTDGTEHESSRLHQRNTLVGVVKYRV